MRVNDNKVTFTNGLVNLKDFPRGELIETKGNTDFYQVPEDVEVLSMWEGELKWVHPESYSVHRELRMFNVTTYKGHTIQCSDEHSLVTVDENLNYKRSNPVVGMSMPRLVNSYSRYCKQGKAKKYISDGKYKISLDYGTGYSIGLTITDRDVEYTGKEALDRFIYKFKEYNHLPEFWSQTTKLFRLGLLTGILGARAELEKECSFTTEEQRLAYEVSALAFSLDMIASVDVHTINHKVVYAVTIITKAKKNDDLYTPTLSLDRLRELYDYFSKESDILSTVRINYVINRYDTIKSVYKPFMKKMIESYPEFFEQNDFWKKYKSMVLDPNIEWLMIKEVTELKEITEAYDITCPPYCTFVMENGIVVYDTVSFNSVVTKESVREIDNLLASKSFYITPDGKLTYSAETDTLNYVLKHLSK